MPPSSPCIPAPDWCLAADEKILLSRAGHERDQEGHARHNTHSMSRLNPARMFLPPLVINRPAAGAVKTQSRLQYKTCLLSSFFCFRSSPSLKLIDISFEARGPPSVRRCVSSARARTGRGRARSPILASALARSTWPARAGLAGDPRPLARNAISSSRLAAVKDWPYGQTPNCSRSAERELCHHHRCYDQHAALMPRRERRLFQRGKTSYRLTAWPVAGRGDRALSRSAGDRPPSRPML
jgi:hypothetical protein